MKILCDSLRKVDGDYYRIMQESTWGFPFWKATSFRLDI